MKYFHVIEGGDWVFFFQKICNGFLCGNIGYTSVIYYCSFLLELCLKLSFVTRIFLQDFSIPDLHDLTGICVLFCGNSESAVTQSHV